MLQQHRKRTHHPVCAPLTLSLLLGDPVIPQLHSLPSPNSVVALPILSVLNPFWNSFLHLCSGIHSQTSSSTLFYLIFSPTTSITLFLLDVVKPSLFLLNSHTRAVISYPSLPHTISNGCLPLPTSPHRPLPLVGHWWVPSYQIQGQFPSPISFNSLDLDPVEPLSPSGDHTHLFPCSSWFSLSLASFVHLFISRFNNVLLKPY